MNIYAQRSLFSGTDITENVRDRSCRVGDVTLLLQIVTGADKRHEENKKEVTRQIKTMSQRNTVKISVKREAGGVRTNLKNKKPQRDRKKGEAVLPRQEANKIKNSIFKSRTLES